MMLRRSLLLAVALFFWMPVRVRAQQIQTPPRPNPPAVPRDANAVIIVQTAIQALGGETLIKQVQTVSFQGSTSGVSQGSSAYMTVVQAPPPQPRLTSTSKPSAPASAATKVSFAPASVALTLVRQLRSNALALKYVGPVVLGTNTLTAVTFSSNLPASSNLPRPSDQIWYFNIQTGLPVRVEYQLTNKPGVIQLQAIDFSDYRPASGILYPFQMVMHRDDQQNEVITIQTVTPN